MDLLVLEGRPTAGGAELARLPRVGVLDQARQVPAGAQVAEQLEVAEAEDREPPMEEKDCALDYLVKKYGMKEIAESVAKLINERENK